MAEKLRNKLRRLEEAYREGRISGETYRELREKIEAELREAKPRKPPLKLAKVAIPAALLAVVAVAALLYTQRQRQAAPAVKPIATPIAPATYSATTPTPAPSPSQLAPTPQAPMTPTLPPPELPETPPPTAASASPALEAPPPEASPTASEAPPVIFDWSAVSYYEYAVTASIGGAPVNGKYIYEVREVREAGRELWLVSATLQLPGGRKVSVQIWVDKVSGSCVKALLKTPSEVRSIECSEAAEESGIALGEPRALRTERVVVPAGSYTCTVYEVRAGSTRILYWVAEGVPVPVKWISYSPGSMITAKLIRYR